MYKTNEGHLASFYKTNLTLERGEVSIPINFPYIEGGGVEPPMNLSPIAPVMYGLPSIYIRLT